MKSYIENVSGLGSKKITILGSDTPHRGLMFPVCGRLTPVSNGAEGDDEAMTMAELESRLATYPGAHPNEEWKNKTDLTLCSEKERAEIARLGLTMEDFRGHTRGEIHHMLFGWRFAK